MLGKRLREALNHTVSSKCYVKYKNSEYCLLSPFKTWIYPLLPKSWTLVLVTLESSSFFCCCFVFAVLCKATALPLGYLSNPKSSSFILIQIRHSSQSASFLSIVYSDSLLIWGT